MADSSSSRPGSIVGALSVHSRIFKLPPNGSLEVVVQVDALPIQSEHSTSRVRLHAEIQRANGTTVQSFTPPLYYQFQQSYTKAQFFTEQDLGDLPDTTRLDLLDVQGRIREADGTWTNAADAAAATAEQASRTGGGRVGLSAFHRVRADATGPMPRPNNVPPPQKEVALKAPDESPLINFTLCTTWATEYADSGLGEDYLDPSNNGYSPAAHALYYVTDPNWNWSTLYAWWWLDSAGCTAMSLPAGNYWIWRYTDDVAGGGVTFRTYTWWQGAEWYDYDVTGFTVGSATTWVNTYPSWNSEAIQVAGITGQVVNQHVASGLGMTAGTYKIHVNEGCGAQYSCYDKDLDMTLISPDTIGWDGVSHAAWKFLVAHEIGHHVQWRGMGYANYGYDLTSSVAQCRCDHYDESWGNNIHCMQSREETGGAALEGFGHMFASRVFNATSASNAVFTHYKPFLWNEWDDPQPPPVTFDAFNPYKWMETWCVASNEGIELDWLNFFYGISHEAASNPTTVSDLFSIYKRACGDSAANCTFQDTVNFDDLQDAALTHYNNDLNSPFFTRFSTTGDNTGVNH